MSRKTPILMMKAFVNVYEPSYEEQGGMRTDVGNYYPKAQNSPKASYSMVFGPKSL